jgi:hypothetical protein
LPFVGAVFRDESPGGRQVRTSKRKRCLVHTSAAHRLKPLQPGVQQYGKSKSSDGEGNEAFE